jgi:hypothetical protein
MKRIHALLLPLVLILAACSAAGSSPSQAPSGSTALSPRPVTSVDDAAARVAEVYPSLAGVGPADPNLIGGCCSWTGAETGDGFTVTYEVGWGDCPSGCIERHSWTFAVSRTGEVTLLDEQGSPVPPGQPGSGVGAGGGSSGSGGGTGGAGLFPGGTGIQGHVLAGPTCPVVKVGDPACEPRPLGGVTLVVLTADGNEAARTTSDANGYYAVALPDGPYTIEAQPVEGLTRAPGPIPIVVDHGVVLVDVPYDTGIR